MVQDKLAILQTKTVTYDTEGMEVAVWAANNSAIWINLQDDSSVASYMVLMQQGNVKSEFKFSIFASYKGVISEGQRVLDGSNSYEILRVRKLGLARLSSRYELLCSLV